MKRAAITRVYVPKFNGNRKLEGSEQVTVDMSLATLKEKEEFATMKFLKKSKMEYVKKEYTALKTKITLIGNYFDENNKPINSAEKLIADAKAGSEESIALSEELWNHIMGYDKIQDDDDSDDDEKDDDDSSESGEPLEEGED